jgi:hypothetical protein
VAVIVDTNVAMVAQGLAVQADQTCVDACIDRLTELTSLGGVVVDEGDEIVGEYVRKLSHAGKPGVGRAFAKWAWDNRFNPQRVTRVRITAINHRGWRRYREFPDEPALMGFDPSDQKFVAVAMASRENPSILNAVDSDWWDHQAALNAAGVNIEFLCPQHAPPAR